MLQGSLDGLARDGGITEGLRFGDDITADGIVTGAMETSSPGQRRTEKVSGMPETAKCTSLWLAQAVTCTSKKRGRGGGGGISHRYTAAIGNGRVGRDPATAVGEPFKKVSVDTNRLHDANGRRFIIVNSRAVTAPCRSP